MEMKRSVIASILLFVLIGPIYGQMFYPKHAITKKYHLIKFAATWHGALSHCHSIGMHLVSISSQAENNRITKQLKDEGYGGGRIWTSGTRLSDDVTWEWMGNGKRMNFTDWGKGQPSNDHNSEKCMEIYGSYKWNDCSCDRKNYFICEQDLIEYQYCTN
ncbi:hepatic lectin-like [Contarinia nasturtii]|uniref:hepatic lectin-like n=1 Tax=Contarinia nasturtii TaxID=265458 RepID=UPI0012D48AD8|nr:hepatic lectin-like [Contarinia nasturtii]